MAGVIPYTFKGELWQYAAPGGWYFISMPQEMASEIRNMLKQEEQGWGRLNAIVVIGKTEWKTAIWFDTKRHTYLLPVKADVRKSEKLSAGKSYQISIWV